MNLFFVQLHSVFSQVPNGFKAQFYTLSEILTPTLAWGFFGPDERLNTLMNYFKEQVRRSRDLVERNDMPESSIRQVEAKVC